MSEREAAPVGGSDVEAEAELVSRFFTRAGIDTWTAGVLNALREHGIRAVLLKGPAVARWLYADAATTRGYVDADLLVSPEDMSRAEKVLRDIGFEPRVGFEPLAFGGVEKHARAWIRASDRANVDLHRTLHGLESVSAVQVWAETIADVETCVVGGVPVDIPGPVMRTLHVVVHARSHGPGSRAAEDLRRAIEQVDRQTWSEASNLARRLGVDDEMGNELRKTEDGGVLATELGLPFAGSLTSYIVDGVRQSEFPPSTYVLWSVASMASYRDKARWIVKRQFPSRSFMRKRYAIASRGVVGLTASYGVRAAQSCTQLPAACWHWVRFNHHLKAMPRGRQPKR